MKFRTILLLTATASLALANALDISDVEDDAGIINQDDNIESEIDDTIDKIDEVNPDAIDDIIPDDAIPEVDEKKDDDVINDGEASDDYNTVEGAEGAEEAAGEAAGEASDDYDEIAGLLDADGEGSDDYDSGISIEKIDELDAAEGEKADTDADAGADEKSDNEDDSGSDATVAAGIAGAAALSSAGIFLWIRKSKRTDTVEHFNSINMV